jgi:O-antigen/teichoic acid export membrane protein
MPSPSSTRSTLGLFFATVWPVGIAHKSVLGFGGQVYMLAVGLISTILVARLLGPEGKGVLAVVAAIPTLALGAASFGLGPALAFMAGKDRYPARELVTVALLWSLALSVVVGALIWLVRDALLLSVLRGLTARDLMVVLLSLPAYYLNAFLGALLAGRGRAVSVAVLSALAATFNLIAIAVASLLFPRNPSAVVLTSSIAAVVSAATSLTVYGSGLAASVRRMVLITKEAAPYAAKSYVGQASSMFFLRADVFFLNYFAGPAAVGVYSVATSLAEKLWLFSSPVATAVYSQITGAEHRDAVRLTLLTSRTLWILNCLAGLVLFALSLFLIPVVYGARFVDAIYYLGILIPGVVVFSGCQPYGQFFSGQLGRPGVTSNLSAAMMLVSAVLYVTLIPVMGAGGAALGSTISYSASLVGYAWLLPRVAGVTLREMLEPTRSDLAIYRSIAASTISRMRRSWPGGAES